MPAVNEHQRRLFALAHAVKKGKAKSAGGAARKIAKSLSSSKIREFMIRE